MSDKSPLRDTEFTEFQFATDFTDEYREFIFFWIPINERPELYELL